MNTKIKDKALIKDSCLIGGQWVKSTNENRIDVSNPFNQEVIASVPSLAENQIVEAIDCAYEAFDDWRNLLASERSSFLRKWHDLILENIDDLATIMVLEQGKPFKEAVGEIKYSASYIEFYLEEAKRIAGDIIPSPFKDTKVLIIKQPIGVVGIITPWNFPCAMMIRKIAPAIACGCTCVIKPDESTPLTAFAIAELSIRAGIPKGVLNFVTGVPEMIGNVLTGSSKVKKISFTGSTEVGKLLMRKSAETLKKVTLELGGNAPFIVFDDANIDNAINGLVDSKFRNAGQTCVCPNRVFVQKTIVDDFISKLMLRVKELRVGNGFEDSEIGPLINQEAIKKIELLIDDANSKGAKIVLGGHRHSLGNNFFEPTIVRNISCEMKLFCTEIFGPVLSIIEFDDVDEVIRLANDTKSGLASYFYSNNMNNIWKVAESLEYGIVGVNSGIISSAYIPFGGVKESGFGREGSKYGIEDYLIIKYIHLKV